MIEQKVEEKNIQKLQRICLIKNELTSFNETKYKNDSLQTINEMKTTKKVMNSSELKQVWNELQNDYVNNVEINMLPIYFNLASLCNVYRATSEEKILELAIGGGLGLYNLVFNTEAEIIGGDISNNMVEATKEKLKKLNLNKVPTLLELDNEDLSRFKSGTFRNVISNLSLDLVSDPLKMLQETKRVLDYSNKNVGAAFSIWGRPENNFFFNVVPNAFKKNKLDIPENRSNIHLSNKEELTDLCKKAGFNNIYIQYTDIATCWTKYEDVEFMLKTPSNRKLFSELDEDTLKLVIDTIKKDFEKEFEEKKRLKLEMLLIYLN